jgi:hypothetical protein
MVIFNMMTSLSDMEWKQVPPECVFNINSLWATKDGKIRNGDTIIRTNKCAKGKDGFYRACSVKGHTLYLHRLVYFAHSDKTVTELLSGTVIFREVIDPKVIVDESGCYRSWFEDLTFVPSPHSVRETVIPSIAEETIHSKYGIVRFNEWRPLYTLPRGETRTPVKSELYEICILKNPEVPCLIRNKLKGIIMNIMTHNGHDPKIGLKPSSMERTINYQLTHILLASAFPYETALYTADHIDDNSKNNCVLNLQWMSNKDNCRKAQAKTAEKRRAAKEKGRVPKIPVFDLPEEVWKALVITEYSAKIYLISNRGRIKNKLTGLILNSKQIRGRKYTSHSIAIEKGVYKTHNTHYLVYRTFHGEVPVGMDILHDDFAPLTPEGLYRNWAEDFTLGPRSVNTKEYHSARRIVASSENTIQLIT